MASHEGYFNVQEKIVADTELGLLLRETSLPNTVWRNAVSDFAGKEDDTISIRVDAYGTSSKRTLRGTGARNKSKLHERKVDVTLEDELYHDVELTDADYSLDLNGVIARVVTPSVRAIREGYEEEVATVIQGATYENSITIVSADLDDDGNLPTDFLFDARTDLNNSSVPQSGRSVVLGSGIENKLLKGQELKDASQAGDNTALRRASVGALAGFDNIFVSNFIDPYKAYAYHRSAYVLVSRAPLVPMGTAWGASESSDGFAIRIMQHLVPNANGVPINVVFTDAWVGTNVVTDPGEFNSLGKFIPAEDPDESGVESLFVRAVEIDATDLEES